MVTAHRYPQNRSQKERGPHHFLRIGPLKNTEFKAKHFFDTPLLCVVSRRIIFRENKNYKNENVYVVPERVVQKEEIMNTKIIYRS